MNTQGLLQVDLLLQIIGSGRLGPTLAAVVGLIGVIIGGLALARSSSRIGSTRSRAMVALVLGLISTVFCGLHLAISTGAIGTGSGRLGAIVGLVLGLIGIVLSGLALARSRRTATGDHVAAASSIKERT